MSVSLFKMVGPGSHLTIVLPNARGNASTFDVVDSKDIAQMATLLGRRIEALEHYRTQISPRGTPATIHAVWPI
jgi:hypothetical protein